MDSDSGTRKGGVPLASRPSVRRKPLRTPYDHGASLQAVSEDTLATPEGESRASGAEGRGRPQHNMRDAIFLTSVATAIPSPQPLRVGSCSVSHHGHLNSDGNFFEHQMWEGRYTAGGSKQTLSTPTSNDVNTEEGPKGPKGPPSPPPSPPLPTPRLVRLSAGRQHVRLTQHIARASKGLRI